MDKILTIIIPTYNMEKYLRHCLDSLIVPNMDKAEVLVINDGSKDSSSAIGHEYQDKYPQAFRVVDKENGNYGSCVNRGIKEAKGKYVKVLDADDSFNKDAFRVFIDDLCNIDSDLVLTDFITVDEDDNMTSKSIYSEAYQNIQKNISFDFVNFINQPNYTFYGQMHGFTYRTQLLKDMHYHQTEGISYTDQEWVFKPVSGVKTCYYIPVVLYRYLVGRSGQTMLNVGKSINQLITVIFSLVNYYITDGIKTKTANYLRSQLENQIDQIYRRGLLDKAFPIDILKEFDKKLSQYPLVYHCVDNTGVIHSFSNFLKYIKYWRKHQEKGLPYFYLLINKLKKI